MELSWWQIEVLLTAAWLLTMFVSFRAGLRYQQLRKNPDEQVTVDEKKRLPEEVFMVQKGTVLHLSSTCSYLSRSEPATMSWCCKCSWKSKKDEDNTS